MVTRIFLFLLCVAISSCDSTEIQYKVCSHVECVDGMVTVETYVMKRSSGGWTMSEIYNNKRHTTVDSMKQIVKIEKQMRTNSSMIGWKYRAYVNLKTSANKNV